MARRRCRGEERRRAEASGGAGWYDFNLEHDHGNGDDGDNNDGDDDGDDDDDDDAGVGDPVPGAAGLPHAAARQHVGARLLQHSRHIQVNIVTSGRNQISRYLLELETKIHPKVCNQGAG